MNLEPWRWVVFDLREPRVKTVVIAPTWMGAKTIGAKDLRIYRDEFAYAVAPCDGETENDAIRRVLRVRKEKGR